MSGSLDRQRCYAYLLEEMELADCERFEAALSRDDVLRDELRACEADLAEFADASVADLRPPARVWSGIASEMRDVESRVVLGKVFEFRSWMPWAAAAAVLLALNVWQYLGSWDAEQILEPALTESMEGNQVSPRELVRLQGELDRLEERLAELDRQRVAAEASDAMSLAALDELRSERTSLVERIEYLETNYVALAEFANPILRGDLNLEGGNAVEFVPFQLPETPGELEGGDKQGDVWQLMASLISEPGMVEIPFFPRTLEGEVFGVSRAQVEESFEGASAFRSSSFNAVESSREVIQNPDTPFALAFVNDESGQAFLSFGNLGVSSAGESNVLWVKTEEDSYFQLGVLPDFGGNMAIQLPVGAGESPEFVISVEDELASDRPSDRLILETQRD